FFQAEGGIRDFHVTGVQTCALPIWGGRALGCFARVAAGGGAEELRQLEDAVGEGVVAAGRGAGVAGQRLRFLRGRAHRGGSGGEIGRASCREGGGRSVGGVRAGV